MIDLKKLKCRLDAVIAPPWVITDRTKYEIADAQGYYVARVVGQNAKNAQLMVQAPDLASAVVDMAEALAFYEDVVAVWSTDTTDAADEAEYILDVDRGRKARDTLAKHVVR